MGNFGWRDGLEILIFWIGLFAIMRFLRGTRGLGILKGASLFVVSLYMISRLLEYQFGIILSRFNFLVEHLVTVAITAFVIIFQPEVRRGLTRLGEKPFAWMSGRDASRSITPIAEAAGRMSRRRIGALIVLERSVGFGGIIDSGVPINAEVSSPLLESVFYPNSPLHDGALIVRGDKLVAASCLLPLSDNPDLGSEFGTRHRAALGLTEETDAVVVVVSEQTGRISVAYRGVIRPMRDARDLENTVTNLFTGGELQAPTSADRSSSIAPALTKTRFDTATVFMDRHEKDKEKDKDRTEPVRRPGTATDPGIRPGSSSDVRPADGAARPAESVAERGTAPKSKPETSK